MLYKEIAIGLLISGFVAQIDQHAFHTIFLSGSPAAVRTIWGALIGPVIAMLTFVCSVGNVPLAAVLWSGGISFAGVVAFIFGDLVILPIVAIYRKYYGGAYAARLLALLLVTMVVAALIVHLIFSGAGLIPSGPRPTHRDIFSGVHVDYKLWLNLVGVLLAAGLFALTVRRGVTDPVCGMTVDRAKALRHEHGGRTYYFCSSGCRDAFIADPERYLRGGPSPPAVTVTRSDDGSPEHTTIDLLGPPRSRGRRLTARPICGLTGPASAGC